MVFLLVSISFFLLTNKTCLVLELGGSKQYLLVFHLIFIILTKNCKLMYLSLQEALLFHSNNIM